MASDAARRAPSLRVMLAVAAIGGFWGAPQARYQLCLHEPSKECLLAIGIDRAKEPNSSDSYHLGAAVAAVAIREPQLAVDIADVDLAAPNFGRVNPHFALPAALKGEALQKMGAPDAGQYFDAAYEHATVSLGQANDYDRLSALMLTAPVLARAGRFAQVRSMYEYAYAQNAPRAHELLAELGLAYARDGQFEQAIAVARELRVPAATPALSHADKTRAEADSGRAAAAVRAMTGDPYAEWTKTEGSQFALVGAARGFAERGDTRRAVAALTVVEKSIDGQAQDSAPWQTIRREAAEAYARIGNAAAAQRLLAGQTYEAVHAEASVAAALCSDDKVNEAGIFLTRAANLARDKAVLDHAYLGLGYSLCGQHEAARAAFKRARLLADAVPYCDGDHCANYTLEAQLRVAGIILQSLEIDQLEDWPKEFRPKEYDVSSFSSRGLFGNTSGGFSELPPQHHLSVAIRLAQLGRQKDAIARLDTAVQRPLTQQRGLHGQLALARAQILLMGGDSGGAKREFDEAYRSAMAQGSPNQRAGALLLIVEAKLRAHQCEAAVPLLHEAHISLDRTRMSGAPGIFHDDAQAAMAALAQDFASCGYPDDALAVVQAVTQPPAASVGRDSMAARLANDVLAEVAAARALRGDTRGALRDLTVLPPLLSTLSAAVAAAHAEASGTGGLIGATPAHDFLLLQAARAGDYFLQAQNDRERRHLIHLFADEIRSAAAAQHPLAGASALFDLLAAEVERITAPTWHARAACELGYTAGGMSRPEAAALMDAGIVESSSFRQRTFPLDPPPSGACAYWIKQSGDTTRAAQVATHKISALRRFSDDRGHAPRMPDTGTLLGLAIAQAEYDTGELFIDWGKRVWDQ